MCNVNGLKVALIALLTNWMLAKVFVAHFLEWQDSIWSPIHFFESNQGFRPLCQFHLHNLCLTPQKRSLMGMSRNLRQ